MPEDRPQDRAEKKKGKRRVRKIIGNVQPSEKPEVETSARPTYEHG